MGRENVNTRKMWSVHWVAWAVATVGLVIGACAVWGAEGDAGGTPAAAPAPPAAPAAKPAAPPPPAGAPAAAAKDPAKIELHVKDEELANVLELLSSEYKLNIVASKSAKGKVTADLYNVSLDAALNAICRAAGLAWVQEAGTIYIHTKEEIDALQESDSLLVTEVFPLNYLTSEEALKLIVPVLSKKGTSAATVKALTGIPSGATEAGGNNFGLPDAVIVRDFPKNLGEVGKILKAMDRRPRQVLVEATILQVTLDDTTSLGINFNALAGVDFRDLSRLATPVNVTGDTAPAAVAAGAAQTAHAANDPWGEFNTQGFAARGTGLNIGVITNNVSFFIHALEEVTDTNVLSNPKVLVLNKQSAEVNVGDQIGYRGAVTQTETANTQDVQFMDVGTRLAFRPYISDDGYIRLEIHPEVSTRGGETIDGVPSKSTAEVTCNVMIKDGHTIVIGGLFEETAVVDRAQVPGLGNIPLLGWLFRSKEDSTLRREIIVLLTPHIMDDQEVANQLGEQALADAKRRCIGTREGFAFFTREQITINHMEEADKAWRLYQETGLKDDLDRAWWNVSLALNASPNNLKGLRLKDQILSERQGEPYMSPTRWTIWDSVHDRLRAIDEAKGAIGPAIPEITPPKPAAKPAPAAPKKEAPKAAPAKPPEGKEANRAN